jgi:beta-lactamase superfamily II metal-dependent hydrolase
MRINLNDNLEVFLLNVERGLSIVIKTPNNYCLLYDAGSTPEMSPIAIFNKNKIFDQFEEYSEPGCAKKKIAQFIISHPHLDHISTLSKDITSVINENSFYITCQNDKESNISGHSIDFGRINNPAEASDEIENYKSLYKERELPLSTLIQYNEDNLLNFKVGYYYLTHKQATELFPKDDQNYSNSLSLVLFLSYHNQSILIPGDITPEAFELIYSGKCEKRFTDYSIKQGEQKKKAWARSTCDQPNLKSLLKKGLTILVAPHHGLESGYPQFLVEDLSYNKPKLVLISDKQHNSNNSGSTHKNYQNGIASSGFMHKGEKRYSLSTVSDGHIKIIFSNTECLTDSSTKIEEIFR